MSTILEKIEDKRIFTANIKYDKKELIICECAGSYSHIMLDKAQVEQLIQELTELKDQMI